MSKRILVVAMAVISSVLILSTCSLGLEPFWKASEGKTAVAFQVSALDPALSSSDSRAVSQGEGYLYIRTLGGPSEQTTSFYGPYPVTAGKLFETTDILAGTYTAMGFLYSSIPLDTRTGDYLGVTKTFAELMSMSDADFNVFSTGGDTAPFNMMINGDACGALLQNVTIKYGMTNTLAMIMTPMVGGTGTPGSVVEMATPSKTLTSSTPSVLTKKFIKLSNISSTVTPGYKTSEITCTVQYASSPILGLVAFYNESGILLGSAFASPGPTAITSDQVYTVTCNNPSSVFLYIEYVGSSVSLTFSKTEVPDNMYSVMFDINGGTGFMSPQMITTGASPNLTPNNFTRPGYAFGGWSLTPTGSVAYIDMAPFTMGSANVTLYALWTPVITYTVTFDSLGGSALSPITGIVAGTTTGTLPPTTRVGYTFNGWNEAPDGLSNSFDGITPVNTNLVVYAQWIANSQSITFYENGGTGTMAGQTIPSDSSAPLIPNTFTRPGYTFAGWSTVAGPATVIYGDAVLFAMGTSNVNLFAQWTPDNLFVTFDFNGGTGSMAPQTIAADSSAPLILNTFTRPGYTFAGWSTTPGIQPVTIYDGDPFMIGVADVTLYAQWNPIFAGGDGTVGTPYQIATVAALKYVNNNLSAYYILNSNLDLSTEPNWVPLGNDTTKFTGNFNGNGMTISNLTITAGTYNGTGLFGYIDGATITNLTLTNINVVGSDYTGGLVGQCGITGTTTITNCSVSGVLTASQSFGGLIGVKEAGGSLIITRCSTNVTLNSTTYGNVGGIIGRNLGATLSRCSASGSINQTGVLNDYIGGLVGYNKNSSISDCYATGNVKGNSRVGGLIGYNEAGTVTNSYSVGAVVGATLFGGLIGENVTSTITDSYYDTASSLQSDTGKGTGYDTPTMTLAATYTTWVSTGFWVITDGVYPSLVP